MMNNYMKGSSSTEFI